VLSDASALALRARPLNVGPAGYASRAAAARRDPMEGEFRRVR
jgi:hypothetical protein